MLAGVKGTNSPLLATYPELGLSLAKVIDERDYEKAVNFQFKIFDYTNLRASFSAKYGGAVFLEAMRLRGFDIKRYPRWPTKSFAAEDCEKHRESLMSIGMPL